jgi:hypothetical protein
MKKWFIILIFSLLFFFTSCGEINVTDEDMISDYSAQNIEVIYRFGGGNATYSIVVTIDSKGIILFKEEHFYDSERSFVKKEQLAEKELTVLYKLIIDADIFNLEEKYFCQVYCPTDIPISFLEIKIDEKLKSITFDYTGPEKLLKIEEKIEEFMKKL